MDDARAKGRDALAAALDAEERGDNGHHGNSGEWTNGEGIGGGGPG